MRNFALPLIAATLLAGCTIPMSRQVALTRMLKQALPPQATSFHLVARADAVPLISVEAGASCDASFTVTRRTQAEASIPFNAKRWQLQSLSITAHTDMGHWVVDTFEVDDTVPPQIVAEIITTCAKQLTAPTAIKPEPTVQQRVETEWDKAAAAARTTAAP